LSAILRPTRFHIPAPSWMRFRAVPCVVGATAHVMKTNAESTDFISGRPSPLTVATTCAYVDLARAPLSFVRALDLRSDIRDR